MADIRRSGSLWTNLTLSVIVLVISLIIGNMTLCHLRKKAITVNAGQIQAPKAKFYGWHLFPNRRYTEQDPDNGKITCFFTNNEGWKDVNHTYQKPEGIKRILFIGDSSTFGVVGLNDLYTRVFQKIMDSLLYDVEVISMGMGGWSTDQELEALMLEGVMYEPDFVVYQFCDNDLGENTFKPSAEGVQSVKPFYYELENNTLKKVNIKQEITENKKGGSFCLADFFERQLEHTKAASSENDSASLKVEIDLQDNEPCNDKAEDFKPQDWGESSISRRYYNPKDTTINAVQTPPVKYQWELLEKLLQKMDSVCKAHNARLLVFCESGEAGQREWELRWKHIFNDGSRDFAKSYFLKYPIDLTVPYRLLGEVCTRNNIPRIRNQRVYKRYVHDPHPNAIGNQNMAMDIADHFIQQRLLE